MTDAPESREALVERARRRAHELYEGRVTPHRSCGIAVAATFDRPHGAYQALRRGGITGCGECGALVAGRLVLGELLGDPSDTGPVTPELRAALAAYERLIRERFMAARPDGSVICNDLVAPFAQFLSPERLAFCTGLAADVAATVADVALAHGASPTVPPPPSETTP